MEYRTNPENLNRIHLSIERIQNNTIDFDLNSIPIIIADIENAQEIYSGNTIFEKAYLTSFGSVKGNVNYKNSTYHLVVLNFQFIEMLELSERELDGVISHELGHIFNKYQFEIVPTHLDVMQDKATISDIERIKTNNRNNNEFYADHFSKITLNSEGLISSIAKFTESEFCENKDLFQLRIIELYSDRIYIGEVHTI